MKCIEQLKQYVVSSNELSEALNYFFDLTDKDAFSKIKSHCAIKNSHQHTELLAVIQLVQKEMNERLGKSIKKLIPIFHEVPECHFFHGVCLSVDLVMPLTIIYFSDVKIGIFATAGIKTDMMRFSLMTPL
jgi:hypothetical protein